MLGFALRTCGSLRFSHYNIFEWGPTKFGHFHSMLGVHAFVADHRVMSQTWQNSVWLSK